MRIFLAGATGGIRLLPLMLAEGHVTDEDLAP
jgi:hypothetical protein